MAELFWQREVSGDEERPTVFRAILDRSNSDNTNKKPLAMQGVIKSSG